MKQPYLLTTISSLAAASALSLSLIGCGGANGGGITGGGSFLNTSGSGSRAFSNIPPTDQVAFINSAGVNLASSSQSVTLSNPSGILGSLALAPGGGAIAFSLNDGAEGGQIDIEKTDSHVEKNVGANCKLDDTSWSPDGKKLAVYNERAQAIQVFDASGNLLISVPLQSNQGPDKVSWSPDSQTLVWDTDEAPVAVEEYSFATNTVSTVLQTSIGTEISGVAFLDPTTLVLTENLGTGGDLYTMPVSGGTPVNLTKGSDGNLDGLKIYWGNSDASTLIATNDKTTRTVEVISGTGTLLTTTATYGSEDPHYDWSAAGNLYVSLGEPPVIYEYTGGVGSPIQVTTSPISNWEPE